VWKVDSGKVMEMNNRNALLELLESAKSDCVTICGLRSPKSHIKDCIMRNIITGCTIDGTSYDFNCTGGIWDKSDFDFINNRLESITRD
jgi:hypothetical protein